MRGFFWKKEGANMRHEEKVWDRFSGLYDKIIKKDEQAYDVMIKKMAATIDRYDKVLEIATGTGIIALSLSETLENITAIDFSEKMIAIARRKAEKIRNEKIQFEVQDACNMNFQDNQFDVVIISNALHIMPDPERVLSEIKRVLKNDGRLIAPTFMHKKSKNAKLFSKLAALVGFKAYHEWDEKRYCAFLGENGFNNVNSTILKSSFNIAYATAILEDLNV